MRIGLTTLGCDSGKSGIGKYLIALMREMPRVAPEVEFVIGVSGEDESIFVTPYPNVTVQRLPDNLSGLLPSLLWSTFSVRKWVRQNEIDVMFYPAGNRRLSWNAGCPTVGCVHDLSGFSVQAKYDPVRMFYIKRVLPAMIRRLTVPLTVSEHSKSDIVRYAHVPEDRIQVVYNGFDRKEYAPANEPATERYWLYVSRIEHPGKNHFGLIEAYDKLAETERNLPKLILAGGDWDGAAQVHERHDRSPNRDRIEFLGFVPDERLHSLVQHAEAVIYPSLYEGFGIPILEAMACAVPVACSNTSSLPEVGGDAVLYFNPANSDSISDAMRTLANDPATRATLSERGLKRSLAFSWEKCARATLTALSGAAKDKRYERDHG